MGQVKTRAEPRSKEEAAPRTRTALRGLLGITDKRENPLDLQQVDQGTRPNVEGDPEQNEAVEDEVNLGPRPDPHPRSEEVTIEIEDGIGSARDEESHYRGYDEDERQLEDIRFEETRPVERRGIILWVCLQHLSKGMLGGIEINHPQVPCWHSSLFMDRSYGFSMVECFNGESSTSKHREFMKT